MRKQNYAAAPPTGAAAAHLPLLALSALCSPRQPLIAWITLIAGVVCLVRQAFFHADPLADLLPQLAALFAGLYLAGKLDYLLANRFLAGRCGTVDIRRQAGITISDHAPVTLEIESAP